MFYVLDGKKVVPEPDILIWAKRLEANRQIAFTAIERDVQISTVFIGIEGLFVRPILFETLIIGGPRDGELIRYDTWEQAQEGHESIVREIVAAVTTGEQ